MRADHRNVVGVRLREHDRIDFEFRRSVRLVFVGLPTLVANHRALQIEFRLRHRVPEVLHTIRFQPKQKRKKRGRPPREVVGTVGRRRGVVRTTAALHEDVEHSVRSAVGAHEHEVFEEMREPRASLGFVLRAHVVPEVHGDGRQTMILVEDHGQAVVESVLLEGHRDFLGVGHGAHEEGDRDDRDGNGTHA